MHHMKGRHNPHRHYVSHMNNRHYRRIQIPTSTNERIIFPFDAASSKFNTSFYTPGMTNNRAGLSEIQDFLRELETNLQGLRLQSGQKPILICFCLLFLLMILVGVVIPVYTMNNGDVEDSFKIFPIMFGILVIGFCMFFSCALRFVLRQRRLQQQAVEFARNHINNKGRLFTEKGLTWVMPIYYPRWIELWTNGAITQPQIIVMGQPAEGFNNGFQQPTQFVAMNQPGAMGYYQPQPLQPMQQMQFVSPPQFVDQQYQAFNQQPQFVSHQPQFMNQGYQLVQQTATNFDGGAQPYSYNTQLPLSPHNPS